MEGEMYLWAAAYHLPAQSERDTPYLKPVFTYYQFNINSQEVDAVTDERAHIKWDLNFDSTPQDWVYQNP